MQNESIFNLKSGINRRLNHDLNSVLCNLRNSIEETINTINKKLKVPIKIKYILFKEMNFKTQDKSTLTEDVYITFFIKKRGNGSIENEIFGKVTKPLINSKGEKKLLKGNSIALKIYCKDEMLLFNMIELIEDVLTLNSETINEFNGNMIVESSNIESNDDQFLAYQFIIQFITHYIYKEFDREKWIAKVVEDFTQNLDD